MMVQKLFGHIMMLRVLFTFHILTLTEATAMMNTPSFPE